MILNTDYIQFVVRHSNEATLTECCSTISSLGVPSEAITLVTGGSFADVLSNSVRAGLSLNSKWVGMIDADVLLFPEQLPTLIASLTNAEDLVEIQFLVFDMLFCALRPAGNHFYQRDFLSKFQSYIASTSNKDRPETRALMAAREDGFRWETKPITIGVHDYKQTGYDIFCKAYVHGKKHAHLLPKLLDVVNAHSGFYKYEIAHYGYKLGASDGKPIVLSRESDYLYQQFCRAEELARKTTMADEPTPPLLDDLSRNVVQINGTLHVASSGFLLSKIWRKGLVSVINIGIKIVNKLLRSVSSDLRIKLEDL